MKYQDVLTTIKTKGYWRISFEPLVYNEQKISLSQCKELVMKNSVQLRGWDYPHIPQRQGDDTALEPGNNYWQGWLDWQDNKNKEFWRMYQSTQFIHYLGLREDWLDDYAIKSLWAQEDQRFNPGDALGVVGTTCQITEIFEFLSRLIADGLYDEGVKVSISLNNTQNRMLIVDRFQRVGFSAPRKTSSEIIDFSKSYSKEEIVSDSSGKSLDAIVHIFERFGWSPPNIEVIKSDQKTFLEGRI
ncbi:MAG: hypothetical protein WC657_05955 [Candidatus Paceibacterota bacterium]